MTITIPNIKHKKLVIALGVMLLFGIIITPLLLKEIPKPYGSFKNGYYGCSIYDNHANCDLLTQGCSTSYKLRLWIPQSGLTVKQGPGNVGILCPGITRTGNYYIYDKNGNYLGKENPPPALGNNLR